MSNLSHVPHGVKPLVMPPASHLAIYRDALGLVSNMRVLCLPDANDAEALEVAWGRKATCDVFCDVFEICETRRAGGLVLGGEAWS